MIARRLVCFAAGLLAASAGSAVASAFGVYSPDMANSAAMGMRQVFNAGGCRGGNISPALDWKNPPPGVKSFAVTLFDPDAPGQGGFWHWVAFGIPANVTALASNAGDVAARIMPENAVQIRNDYGLPGYGGPCPPPGQVHRYILTLYALNVAGFDGLDENASVPQVREQLRRHVLGSAKIIAKYPE
jgi:Raf kinase inhibitor-like YbhB/YbcL family protein